VNIEEILAEEVRMRIRAEIAKKEREMPLNVDEKLDSESYKGDSYECK